MPREIIPGEDDSPYALRSDLGWGIIGKISQPLSEEDGDEDEIGVSHRIYTCEAWEPPDPQVDAVEPSKRGCWKSRLYNCTTSRTRAAMGTVSVRTCALQMTLVKSTAALSWARPG